MEYKTMGANRWLLLLTLSVSFPGLAAPVPPVGRRIYIIDSQDQRRGVSIVPVPVVPSGLPYMRDPLDPGIHRVKAQKQPGPAPKPAPLAKNPAVVTLKSLRVVGNFSHPRVKFDRVRPALSRIEENPSADFLDRVLDDAEKDL